MRYAILLLVPLFVLLAACGGGEEERQPTPTPSPAAARPSPTLEPTATATPTAVPKHDPQTLLQAGYVLDQALDVNLDGSETGQIVVISHTSQQGLVCSGQALNPKTGTPLPTPQSGCEDIASMVPTRAGCLQDPNLEATACWFRAEVFTFEDTAGWTSSLVSANHRGGVQDIGGAQVFALDDERKAVVLAFHYCTGTGSGCGWVNEVVAMQGGQVKSTYSTWQARLEVEPSSATFSNPVIFLQDAFCCPSGFQIDKLALDPATGELGVVQSRLDVCAQGTLAHNPTELYPDNLLELACDSGANVLFETAGETVVEPSSIGGVGSLRQGQHVRIEYNITQCSPGGADCWGRALLATKITVLNP